MKCESCKGTGKSAKKGQRCFNCNGTGFMCDVCGEAADDAGMDICNKCQEEQKDDE